jgi:NAD(P)-dependent dehydrogenase (short-subunit alcohol dehydrogenase family)
MSMKTIVVVGTGQGFGYSVAKVFGKQGYNVALISRSKLKLDTFCYHLQQAGINARGFEGSMLDRRSLKKALERAEDCFGQMDVLVYSPAMAATLPIDVLDVTDELFGEAASLMVNGAIVAANHMIPAMTDAGRGALIFTAGLSATTTIPQMDHNLMATAALEKYAVLLNAELERKGVYSVLFSLDWFTPGPPYDPDDAAQHLYENVFLKRENAVEAYPCGKA